MDGDEIQGEVEKVEVEAPKKVRKPMSAEALERLALAREKANAKRRELAEERKVHKESLVKKKMEEEMEVMKTKDEKAATKEAKRRIKQKRESIIIERESSGSSSEDDIRDARVYTVRKSRPPQEEPTPRPVAKTDDPLDKMYGQLFRGTQTLL